MIIIVFLFVRSLNINLNVIIQSKIEKSRLYGVTRPKVIKEMYSIPLEVNLKKIDKVIDSYYGTFYIKKTWAKDKLSKNERREKFLNIEKEISERYTEIPFGEAKENYRKISVINKCWLKIFQKKLNKFLMSILLTDKIRGKKQESIIPYLYSSVKKGLIQLMQKFMWETNMFLQLI